MRCCLCNTCMRLLCNCVVMDTELTYLVCMSVPVCLVKVTIDPLANLVILCCCSMFQEDCPTILGLLPSPLALVPLIGSYPTNTGITTVSWSLPQHVPVPAPWARCQLSLLLLQLKGPIHQAKPYPLPKFCLSLITEPFPQKLVDKVRSGQFVKM